MLRGVDLFFPNEIEARHLTNEENPEDTLNSFRLAGLKRVALKLGARGAALLWDGDITFLEAHPVTPIDTTGAGDCFDAGFLHGWLRGETPRIRLQMANICGALSTTKYGGVVGFPTPEYLHHELQRVSLCAK
jgi:sugar/nucleoside kinase (ribokinase family)